jgi:hypothetical protein
MTLRSKHLLIAAALVVLSAAGDVAASRPATQPGKTKPPIRVPQRVKLLKGNIDSFAMHLSYLAVKKEQSAGASFRTWKGPGPPLRGHLPRVWISKARAAAIIDHLDNSGVLARLLDPGTLAIIDMLIPAPHLHVQVTVGKLRFENWLPIDPKAVELVEALGKLLDGKAAKATGKVLKALEPQRKKWREAAAVAKFAVKPTVKWGKAVSGLVCGISAFKKNIRLGVSYEIEVSIKNVSTRDIGLFKRMLGNGDDRIILTRAGKQYREHYTIDSKAMQHAAVSAKDLVRLKPKDIYKFTHKTLIYPRSMGKKYWNVEVDLGHMAVDRQGVHQMHVKYEPLDLRLAKGVDLGDLKPWKGILLSAPVEVVVAKTQAGTKSGGGKL